MSWPRQDVPPGGSRRIHGGGGRDRTVRPSTARCHKNFATDKNYLVDRPTRRPIREISIICRALISRPGLVLIDISWRAHCTAFNAFDRPRRPICTLFFDRLTNSASTPLFRFELLKTFEKKKLVFMASERTRRDAIELYAIRSSNVRVCEAF